MPFVFSTASQNADYSSFYDSPNGQPYRKARTVTINGGANVTNRKSLDTPRGVVTEVTDEEAVFLENHPDFQRHMKAGFVTIEKRRADPDKVAKDMTQKDKSAQLVSDDFKGSKAKPTTLEDVTGV